MEFGSQNLSFGDFSNLSEEEHEKVFTILHGSRGARDRKVEFPWDNIEQRGREAVKPVDSERARGPLLDEGIDSSDREVQYKDPCTEATINCEPTTGAIVEGFVPSGHFDTNRVGVYHSDALPQTNDPPTTILHRPHPGVEMPSYSTSVGDPNMGVNAAPEISFQHSPSPTGYVAPPQDRSDSSSSGSGRGSSDRSREVTPTDGTEFYSDNGGSGRPRASGRLLASMKTYERRNKKKRPPGYYEKIAQEELQTRNPVNCRQDEYGYMQPHKDNPGYQNAGVQMVAPPTSHQPQMITSPVMIPAGGFSGRMVPVFPVPPGYPMPPFQGRVPMTMHPPGVPLLPGHMQQQQHGLMPMPPPAHMGSQVAQPQHIVPMEMPNSYQRNPVTTQPPPMVSQDVRQHPPGLGPSERQIMSHHPKSDVQYGGMRRPSPTERLQPDPRDVGPQRYSEPRLGPQQHHAPAPLRVNENLYKDSGRPDDGNAADSDSLKIIKDVKSVPLIEETQKCSSASADDSEGSLPLRTSEVANPPDDCRGNEPNVESSTLNRACENSSNIEHCDTKSGKEVSKFDEPKTDCAANNETILPTTSELDHTVNNVRSTDCVKPVESVSTETVSSATCKLNSEVKVDESIKSDTADVVGKSGDDKLDINEPEKTKDSDTADALCDIAPQPSAPVQAPRVSWAGLFKGGSPSAQTPVATPVVTGATNNSTATVNNTANINLPSVIHEDVKQPVPASEDSAAKQLGELLTNYETSFEASPLQPRGLMNRGNWCYVNATLQALLACPALNNLLKKLPNFPALTRGPSSTPILDSLVEFVNEFSPMQLKPVEKIEKGKKRVVSPELVPGTPFEPSNVYKMLQVIESSSSFKGGKQEDAEEFLSCVLNGLHEEMAAAIKQISEKNNIPENHQEPESEVANGFLVNDSHKSEGEEEDQWEQVGPRNKSVFTRKANFAKTPVSDIFAGQIRSAVFQAGSRESAMLEPFFTLQLDIQSEKVYTVKEALEGLVSKESVQGFTCSKTKAQVEVTRRTTLESLPPVLILHLKCFIYDKNGGCQKLLKKIDYATDLEISRDLLSPNVRSKLPTNQRMYKLFAVVYHHGKNVSGGHYTTDIYHPGINSWIHMDDSNIKQVNLQQVLKFVSPRVPYLLYYRRMDIV